MNRRDHDRRRGCRRLAFFRLWRCRAAGWRRGWGRRDRLGGRTQKGKTIVEIKETLWIETTDEIFEEAEQWIKDNGYTVEVTGPGEDKEDHSSVAFRVSRTVRAKVDHAVAGDREG